jgi:hypothetical protein
MTTTPLPVKRAVDISKLNLMDDGGWLDQDDHFNVKTVPEDASETEIQEAIRKSCKFMCLRDLLRYLHKTHKEASHYQTLGINGNPYRSFDEFYEYVHQSCLTNDPSKIESINAHYQHLCKKNNLSDGELFPVAVSPPETEQPSPETEQLPPPGFSLEE